MPEHQPPTLQAVRARRRVVRSLSGRRSAAARRRARRTCHAPERALTIPSEAAAGASPLAIDTAPEHLCRLREAAMHRYPASGAPTATIADRAAECAGRAAPHGSAGRRAEASRARPTAARAASPDRRKLKWLHIRARQLIDDTSSRPQRVEDEVRKLTSPLVEESRERRVVLAEDDAQHRPRDERKDAQRDQIHEKLVRRYRTHRADLHLLVDLRTESWQKCLHHARRMRARNFCRQRREPLGIEVLLCDDITRNERTLPHGVDVKMNELLDLLLDAALGAEHGDDRRHHPPRNVAENSLGQAVLGPEVIVQQRLVDAGLLGDLLHSRAGGPVPHEDRSCRPKDPVLGLAVLIRGHY